MGRGSKLATLCLMHKGEAEGGRGSSSHRPHPVHSGQCRMFHPLLFFPT
jgi:hypothetical protein